MYDEIFKWLAMIEIPVFATIFRGLFLYKKDIEQELSELKNQLYEFKIHVARNYVSNTYLKDVENRLTAHLLRIEKKLDQKDEP